MNVTEFLKKQEQIYEDFRDFGKQSVSNGATIPPVLNKERRGCILAFQFDSVVADLYKQISNLDLSIYKLNPLEVLHSTVTVSKDIPTKKQTKKLVQVLSRRNIDLNTLQFDFREILFNHNSIILAGYPNKKHIDFCTAIVKEFNELPDLEFRLPKMAHVTMARVVNDVEKNIDYRFFENLKNQFTTLNLPFNTAPMTLLFGKFNHNKEGYEFTSYI